MLGQPSEIAKVTFGSSPFVRQLGGIGRVAGDSADRARQIIPILGQFEGGRREPRRNVIGQNDMSQTN